MFKRPTPQEQLRAWQKELRSEMRGMERQVREIQRTEKTVEKNIKDAVKRGEVQAARILAKELVRSRKAVARLYANRAQLNSVHMQLAENIATAKAVGHFQKSSEVMKSVNKLVKVPEVMKTMSSMSREMMKAGLMEEMIEDAMDSALDDEELEEETEEEVNKVLEELAATDKEKMSDAPKTKLPVQKVVQQQVEVEEEESPEFDQLQARLDAIRS